jgi:hypothetical protein
MSCTGSMNCACGCCAEVGVQTPQAVSNLPGLSSIVYRTGTWATFRESMHARLSSFDYPALAPLKTREDDDFTIAFLDAASVMLDILTFYQERLANESYLRTAVQLRSLTELGRLIDYQPVPGVSASVYLAFTLTSTPGLTPDPSTPAITIPAGTQTQSVPAQGQTPQTFETLADIQAKADWNAQPVQTGAPWAPAAGDTSVYLAGTSTQLQPGDFILVVGDQTNWNLCLVTTVAPDTVNKRTLVQWSNVFVSGSLTPPSKVYALRQRAALFGYNAVDPNLLTVTTADNNLTTAGNNLTTAGNNLTTAGSILTAAGNNLTTADNNLTTAGNNLATAGNNLTTAGNNPIITGNNLANLIDQTTDITKWTWKSPPPPGYIDLDSVYSKVVTGSWLVMIAPNPTKGSPAVVNLYLATSVSPVVRSGFGLSAKITRIVPYPPSTLDGSAMDPTIVLAQIAMSWTWPNNLCLTLSMEHISISKTPGRIWWALRPSPCRESGRRLA